MGTVTIHGLNREALLVVDKEPLYQRYKDSDRKLISQFLHFAFAYGCIFRSPGLGQDFDLLPVNANLWLESRRFSTRHDPTRAQTQI